MKRLAIIFTLFVTSLFFVVYHAYAWSQYNHLDLDAQTHTGNNPAIVPYFNYYATDFVGNDTFNRISLKVAMTNSQPYVLIYVTQGEDIFEDCVTTDGTSNQQVISATFENSLSTEGNIQVQILGFTQYSNCAPGGNHSQNYSLPVTIYGVNDDLGSSIYFSVDGVSVDEFTPWFEFVNAESSLTIGTPSDGSSVAIGSYTFSGECPENGPGYALRYSGFSNAPTHIDDFDIECTDFVWSSSIDVLAGVNTYFIYKSDCLDTNREIADGTDHFYGCFGMENGTTRASSSVIGINNTDGYLLSLIYPKNNEPNGITNIVAGDWRFRFKYNVPSGVPRSDVSLVINYCGAAGWETCATSILNDTLDDLDTTGKLYVDTYDVDVEEGVYRYYVATLEEDSNIKEMITFYTYGSTADDALPVTFPGDQVKNCGKYDLICEALVVDPAFITNIRDLTRYRLEGKFPFAIYYDIRDQFDARFVLTAEQHQAFVAPVHTTAGNVNIPLFNTESVPLQDAMDIFRPWLSWSLWLGCVGWVFSRIRTFKP